MTSKDQLNEMRRYLLRAKVYRLLGVFFIFLGLAIFFLLYTRAPEAGFFAGLTDPFVIGVILFPFIAAFLLTSIGNKYEKRLLKTLDDTRKSK